MLLRDQQIREDSAASLRQVVGGRVDTRDPESILSDETRIELLRTYDYIVMPLTLPQYGSLRLVELAHEQEAQTRLILVSQSYYVDDHPPRNGIERHNPYRTYLASLFDSFHGAKLNYADVARELEQPVSRGHLTNEEIRTNIEGILHSDPYFGISDFRLKHLPVHRRAPTFEEYRRGIVSMPTNDLRNNPWFSGSFFLVSILSIMITIAAIARMVSPWAVPPVVIGGVLGTSVIGAFQLRNDNKLSQKNFLSLMIEALKRLPLLTRGAPRRT